MLMTFELLRIDRNVSSSVCHIFDRRRQDRRVCLTAANRFIFQVKKKLTSTFFHILVQQISVVFGIILKVNSFNIIIFYLVL